MLADMLCTLMCTCFLTAEQTAGLAAAPGISGLHVAHKWLADSLVYLSRDATAYSAVKVVRRPLLLRMHVYMATQIKCIPRRHALMFVATATGTV